MIESLLLAAVRVLTFNQQQPLTNATGFFFERSRQLYLVTSRHVVFDEPGQHFPSHIILELHSNAENLTETMHFSVPLYRNGQALWRQGTDTGGNVDVAVIPIDRDAMSTGVALRAFTPQHLLNWSSHVEIGTSCLVVGFPLGFMDSLHHMPVVRQGIVASSFGLRFQGQGFFLTDARTHRGTSGSPVVMRDPETRSSRRELPWILLAIHSARMDVGGRDLDVDEALGLNCAWYADILLTLTEQ
jgi:hypothetical protein